LLRSGLPAFGTTTAVQTPSSLWLETDLPTPCGVLLAGAARELFNRGPLRRAQDRPGPLLQMVYL